jgi:hypothetical protein
VDFFSRINDKKLSMHVKILEYYRKQTLSEHDFHFVIFFQMKNKINKHIFHFFGLEKYSEILINKHVF